MIRHGTGRQISTGVQNDRGRLLPGDPRAYRSMFGLGLWLRADTGITLGSTLRAGGSSPPAVTISGSSPTQVGLHMEIDSVAGGTGLGQATFKWSVDDGDSYVATGVATAASVALGTTGITAAFAAGPYSIDNTWDCTVSAWADQSGSGNNVSQATAANQPRFIVSGVGGTPEVFFSLANTTQMIASSNITSTALTALMSIAGTATASRSSIITTREWAMGLNATGTVWSVFTTADSLASSDIKDGNLHLLDFVIRASNDIDLTTDGTLVTRTNGSGQQARSATAVGGNGAPNAHNATCRLKELIVFTSAVPENVLRQLRLGIRARSQGAL